MISIIRVFHRQPTVERTHLGLYKSTVSPYRTIPSIPNAAAVRRIVPRLPASFMLSSNITFGQFLISSILYSGFCATATTLGALLASEILDKTASVVSMRLSYCISQKPS